MLFGKELDKLEKDGFIILSDYLTKMDRETLSKNVIEFREEYHTEKNIRNRISYPSDVTDSRMSNAYMVTTERQFLPSIRLSMFNAPL